MIDILSGLSTQQREAVTYSQGPLLVLAGPGAGKTTVLTRRIAHILSESKGDHFKILALTFTNKAAKEMQERVESLMGEETRRAFIGTFHSFSHDLIKSYGSYIGLSPNSVIYDDVKDLTKLLIDAVRSRVDKEMRGDIEASVLSEKYKDVSIIGSTIPSYYDRISRLKNRLVTPDNLSMIGPGYSQDFALVFQLYNDELRRQSALDFADLLCYAYELLTKKDFVRKQMRLLYKHILIDEGQDTNQSQFKLITTLCGSSFRNLFIVADEDQLIFEWNDAKFEHLLSLVEKYGAEIVQLFESYRCPRQVLEIANKLIKHNRLRIGTKLDLVPSVHEEKNEDVFLNIYQDEDEEAYFVCRRIKEIARYTNTCIIARNRYMLERIGKKLDEMSIPYYMPMGQERFSSREMNLIVDLLRLVHSENDKVRLYYICGHLGLDYDRLLEAEYDNTLLQALIDFADDNIYLSSITTILKEFKNNKNNFKIYYERLKETIVGVNEVDEDISEDGKLFEETYQHYTYERQEQERDLGDFLNYLALSPRKDLSGKGVALLTGHAAKGLEFSYVFLVSMNQGVFPDYRAREGTRALEEERRNCFVAVTRTKKNLFISHTRFRSTKYGPRQQEPSQFLGEMALVS